MQFSKTIRELQKKPNFRKEFLPKKIIEVEFQNLEESVGIILNTYEVEGDPYIKDIFYQTELNNEYLGIVDGYIQLIQNKPLDSIKRVGAKELDHFLRDNPAEPAVPYYPPSFYDVLGIGESIFNYFKKSDGPQLLIDELDAPLEELSFSEQIESFEEFLAKHIYPKESFFGIEFDFEELEDSVVTISVSKELSKGQKEYFENNYRKEFNLDNYKFHYLL